MVKFQSQKSIFVAVALSFSAGLWGGAIPHPFVCVCWVILAWFRSDMGLFIFLWLYFSKGRNKVCIFLWYENDERVNSAFQKVFALLPGAGRHLALQCHHTELHAAQETFLDIYCHHQSTNIIQQHKFTLNQGDSKEFFTLYKFHRGFNPARCEELVSSRF